MKYIGLARVSHSAIEASAFQLRCKGVDRGGGKGGNSPPSFILWYEYIIV